MMKVCAAPGCNVRFNPKTHNQLYHSISCKKEVKNINKRKRFTDEIIEAINTRTPVAEVEPDDGITDYLRKEVQRLGRENEKIKHLRREQNLAVREAILDGLSNLHLDPIEMPDVRMAGDGDEEVAVIMVSDLQLSKVTPTYNTAIAEQRMERYADQIIKITEIQRADHPVNTAQIWLLGDIIEGSGIFPGQSYLVDAGFYRQVTIHGPRILANFFRKLLNYFEEIDVHCVIGNHGRMGTRARDEFDPETNGDRMLYRIMDHIFATEDRINFIIPDGPGERNWYSIATIGNYRTLLCHGDQFQSFASMYTIGRKVLGYKEAIDEEWDDMAIGHFHQSMRLTFGKTVLRVGGTVESSNTYAQERLASTGVPSQHLMFVHPERGFPTAEYDVMLETGV